MSRADKAALLAEARGREKAALAALGGLLAGPCRGGGGDGSEGTEVAEAAWPSARGPAAAAAGPQPYAWPSYDLDGQELDGDAVLAAVAAAQWRRLGVHPGWAGGHGSGGGRLLLTLDACTELLRSHPDPELRRQVYQEGLAPLAAAALEHVQALRDARAQQAELYGLYDSDGAAAVAAAAAGAAAAASAPGDGGRGGSGHFAWHAATLYRGSGGGSGGYAGLAHLDSLAGDGGAAAAFLTSLAEALAPLVREQLRRLRALAAAQHEQPATGTGGAGTPPPVRRPQSTPPPRPLPPLDRGSLERLLVLQAWGGGGVEGLAPQRAGGTAAAEPTAARAAASGVEPAAAEDSIGDGGPVAPLAGPGLAPMGLPSQPPGMFPDPASPYLTDLAALLSGASDWLGSFMGVTLHRPARPARHHRSKVPDPRDAATLDYGASPQGSAGGSSLDPECGVSAPAGPSDGVASALDDVAGVPYDVATMLRSLAAAELSAAATSVEGAEGGAGCGAGAVAAAAAGGEGTSSRGAALAALRDAASLEPGRFLALRVVLEGEVEEEAEGEEEEEQEGVRRRCERRDGQNGGERHGRGGGRGVAGLVGGACAAASPVRWLLIDRSGGYGTRYLLPPAPVAVSGERPGLSGERQGPPQHRVVAVAVGLQSSSAAGGLVTGAGQSSLTHGSAFLLWELLHELGHALHFLLAAAPPPSSVVATASNASAAVLPAVAAATRKEGAGATPRQPPPSSSSSDGGGGGAGCYYALLPYQLPLELVELPSSLLERAAADEDVLAWLLARCRHAHTGAPPTPDVSRRLARAVRWTYYSPISVQIQVLLSLHDTVLLSAPRKAPGAARRLWRQLLVTFAPDLPVEATVQQLLDGRR
ncbi:hypothetical protein GPECTOR_17g861 [Gonium pectorale]|uniref:Uncharacterized protein n=1 Tax=Gonium pectorale TaxID=33097 RepID=A0A150GKB3_GONPE|nr:hypothetical protein GPECTOR_17g861 [Gonium pectorale]|eukprot:KXZ50224.1 hypothetical protein GPECTOR_17g861 [Gonium pectorale]